MSALDTEIDLKEIKAFISFLKEKYQYDFSDYASSSFKRRLQRLIELYSVRNLDQLKERIQREAGFVEKVVEEITVNTTEMFRDPTFWRKLESQTIPEILKVSPDKIKIWHAACSSGEEVYSMAILLTEMGLYDKAQIVATDINEEVIKTAKDGIYLKRSLEVNNSNFQRYSEQQDITLSKYYKEIDNYNIKYNPELLKNVTFKRYNLVNGMPFSKFDLILIRNVLIYFNFDLQERVVSTLEQSLFPYGYLGLGSKETIAWCASAKNFRTIDAEDKLYKKLS
jgi:chemotaxis protein methyltransferase CheR